MKARSSLLRPVSLLVSLLALTPTLPSSAQPAGANYDETKVGTVALPDPLVTAGGATVRDAKTWTTKRRPELLDLFATQMYGRSPGRPSGMKFEVTSLATDTLGGKATRKEVRVWLTGKKDGPWMDILLYVPNDAPKPAPAFLGMNFSGNHAISTDPGIKLSERWMRGGRDASVVNNRATEASRGSEAKRWAVDMVLSRGYAIATVYYGDLEPDFAEGWKTGVRAALGPAGAQTEWKPDDWGAISAWAWGLRRAMDYLEKDSSIDAGRVAVLGHSRLGKTSLWAGAQDERFAIVISNDSGEGGAALARRNIGETTAIINKSFPHWFCGNFKQYGGNETKLPFDQHELIALVAPRPVYVASAAEDSWADPRGEFLAAKNAEPVYRLFGKPGLGVEDMPKIDQPVGDFIGYHIRTGKHDVTDYDWTQYLNFADRHFKRVVP
ncbi:MAG: acetylxylan esterase [Verrucomicrobia bacterium]|nr:acetylxylan esterase [Verrucomicrobiota bacterium]